MKRLLAFVLLFVAVSALAGPQVMEAKGTNMTVRLFPQDCSSEKVRALIGKEESVKDEHFFATNVTWQGKDYEACWMSLDHRHVLIVDETGDAGAIPIAAFKPAEGL